MSEKPVSEDTSTVSTPNNTRSEDMRLLKRLAGYLLQHKVVLLLSIVFLIISSAIQPLLAYLMKPLINDGFNGTQPYYIWLIPTLVVVLFFLRGLFNFLSNYCFAWVTSKMLVVMRMQMFAKLLYMPDSEFQKGESGRLFNRFAYDVGAVSGAAAQLFVSFLREVFVIAGILILLFYLSWKLTLVVFVVAPLMFFIVNVFSKKLRSINRDRITVNAEFTHVVQEAIDGHREVKMFQGQAYEKARFHTVNEKIRQISLRDSAVSSLLTPITQLGIAIAVAIMMAVAIYQGRTGALTVGAFVAFVTALVQIFDPLRRLTGLAGMVQNMLASTESVFTLIDQVDEQNKGQLHLENAQQASIQFDQVSFQYESDPEHKILDQISVEIQPGETVAIVGRSGAGKTTLVNLLPCFLRPTEGVIRINGHNIDEYILESLRAQMSLVSQQVVLFEGSVAQNVAYGKDIEKHQKEIEEALKAANLYDYLMTQPEGLQTPVGENGGWLSGGQRQRLAIARAIMKNAPILILDEATSALDNESERQVQKALEILMEGRTTLVIAHRLSTVRRADRILVMDKGRIVEQGNHDALLAKDGLYATLYKMQFKDDVESSNTLS